MKYDVLLFIANRSCFGCRAGVGIPHHHSRARSVKRAEKAPYCLSIRHLPFCRQFTAIMAAFGVQYEHGSS
jgi:hypothetical protein